MQRPKAKLDKTRKATPTTDEQTSRMPRLAQRQSSHARQSFDPQAPLLTPCSMRGPDGKERPGWELWVGGVFFGRADSKESLLEYYTRIHEPMPSGHWRERAQQDLKRAPRSRRPHKRPTEEGNANDTADLWEDVAS